MEVGQRYVVKFFTDEAWNRWTFFGASRNTPAHLRSVEADDSSGLPR
jgi:hypothetical protein